MSWTIWCNSTNHPLLLARACTKRDEWFYPSTPTFFQCVKRPVDCRFIDNLGICDKCDVLVSAHVLCTELHIECEMNIPSDELDQCFTPNHRIAKHDQPLFFSPKICLGGKNKV